MTVSPPVCIQGALLGNVGKTRNFALEDGGRERFENRRRSYIKRMDYSLALLEGPTRFDQILRDVNICSNTLYLPIITGPQKNAFPGKKF